MTLLNTLHVKVIQFCIGLTFLCLLWQYLVCVGPDPSSPILVLTLLLRLGAISLTSQPLTVNHAEPLLSPTQPIWRETILNLLNFEESERRHLKIESGQNSSSLALLDG